MSRCQTRGRPRRLIWTARGHFVWLGVWNGARQKRRVRHKRVDVSWWEIQKLDSFSFSLSVLVTASSRCDREQKKKKKNASFSRLHLELIPAACNRRNNSAERRIKRFNYADFIFRARKSIRHSLLSLGMRRGRGCPERLPRTDLRGYSRYWFESLKVRVWSRKTRINDSDDPG